MAGIVFKSLGRVGLVLIGLTLFAAMISDEGGVSRLGRIAIFTIAVLKAEQVLDNFVEALKVERHRQFYIACGSWLSLSSSELAF